MQLGFVIDHSRCIGCHACTVACKSENDVPLGDFRTWVKYTEEGSFPEVRRSFAVLRCNQCSDAPCVTICPVSALEKRGDGIVDVDPEACIGCKACMHGCPYDALYLNEAKGTAEKCHFCAHRVEMGLAPACAVVCPTEAIVPGDFDDPQSAVSRLRREHLLTARKPEAGTGPNVLYRDAAPAGLDPVATSAAGGYLWSDRAPGLRVDAETFAALEEKARARTVYDVPRGQLWGAKITGYLFAKSLAAGAFPVAWLAHLLAGEGAGRVPALLSLLFLAVTGGLLIADLKRPERFYKILIRPNWSSWLARGTFLITIYGGLLALALLVPALTAGAGGIATLFGVLATLAGGLTAAYTGWLFAQARGRVLWMKRGYWWHLLAQAAVAGGGLLACLQPLLGWSLAAAERLSQLFALALALHVVAILLEGRMAPRGREREYHRAARLLSHGPLARQHWSLGVGVGVVLPLLLVLFAPPLLFPIAGLAALAGLWVEEDHFVRAGQAPAIS